MTSGRFAILACLALLAAVFASGFPALSNGFIAFDDPQMIEQNELLDDPGPESVRRAFTEEINDARLPLYVLALMPEAALFDRDPAAYHAFSLVWHALNAALVLALLLTLGAGRFTAFAASLLFAVHPMTVESVAWASGRKDQLSLALLLAGLLAFQAFLGVGERPRWAWLPVAAAAFLAGCFAKASVVVYPLLAFLVLRLRLGRRGASIRGPGLLAVGLLLALAAIPVWIHLAVARQTGAAGASALHGPYEGFLLLLDASSAWLWHFLLPVDLSIHYHLLPEGGPFTAARLLGMAVLTAMGLSALAFLEGRGGLVTFSAAWIACALLPFNNVLPRTSVPLADRYFAVALPCAALLAALLIGRLPRAPLRGACLALVALLLGTLTALRTAEFRDTETVFAAARRHDPADPLPPLKLGEDLVARGRLPAAIEMLGEAAGLSADPVQEVRARLLLGNALLRAGRFDGAYEAFERVRAITEEDPARFAAIGFDADKLDYDRAMSLLGMGRNVDGRAIIDDILGRTPDYPWARLAVATLDVRNGMGSLLETGDEAVRDLARRLVRRGLDALEKLARDLQDDRGGLAPKLRREVQGEVHKTAARAYLQSDWVAGWRMGAIRHAEHLVSLDPAAIDGYCLRAEVYRRVGDGSEARRNLLMALARDPSSERVLLLLADHYRQSSEARKARQILLSILQRNPGSQAATRSLAELYTSTARSHLNSGKRDLAFKAVTEALRLQPDLVEAQVALGDVFKAMERWEDARAAYAKVLAVEPANPDARMGLAHYWQAFGLGTQTRTKAILERTASADRERMARELEEKVRDAFRKALQFGGDASDLELARRYLARIDRKEQQRVAGELVRQADEAWKAGDQEKAIGLLAQATRVNGTDPDLWLDLATRLDARKEYGQALNSTRRALALDRDNLRALALAARLYYIRGETARCATAARRFLEAARNYPSSTFLERVSGNMRSLLALSSGKGPASRPGGDRDG